MYKKISPKNLTLFAIGIIFISAGTALVVFLSYRHGAGSAVEPARRELKEPLPAESQNTKKEETQAKGPALTAHPEKVFIVLNNGGELRGVIERQTGESIALNIGGGTVLLNKSDVKSLTPLPADETGTIVSNSSISEEERKKQLDEINERDRIYAEWKESVAEYDRTQKEYRVPFRDRSRIIVDVMLDDKVKTRMIVDTGAPLVYIPRKIAILLPDINSRIGKLEHKFMWPDGTVSEGNRVILRSVKIGPDIEARNVEAIVYDIKNLDHKHAAGLLGMSFLGQFNLTVDAQEKELVFREK